MALQAMQDSPDARRRCEILVQLGDAHARAGDLHDLLNQLAEELHQGRSSGIRV